MSSALRGRPGVLGAGPARLMAVALGCLALAAVVYALALGTEPLLRLDRELRFPQVVGDWRLRDDASWAFAAASRALFVAGSAGVLAVALAAGGMRRAVAAAAVVGGGPLAAWGLAAALGAADPVGGEALRASQGAFPSGHAAFALSLGLGLVVALPPRRRAAGGAAAVVVATGMAAGLVALGWHYPSDVVGAFLVSLAVAAAVVAVARPGAPAAAGAAGHGALAAAALPACAALGALALLVLPDESPGAFVGAHRGFVAFCASACLLALACVAALGALAGRSAR